MNSTIIQLELQGSKFLIIKIIIICTDTAIIAKSNYHFIPLSNWLINLGINFSGY